MKKLSTEKKMIAGIALLLVLLVVSMYVTIKQFEEAGGIKGLIVEVGKEIKDIKKQIETAP